MNENRKNQCDYCGSEIKPGYVNCPNCGAPIKPVPGRSPYSAYQPYTPTPPKQQTLSLIAFGLAIGGFFFGLFLFIPALIVGVRALKREPDGRIFAKIAIWISAVFIALWGLIIIAIVAAAVSSY